MTSCASARDIDEREAELSSDFVIAEAVSAAIRRRVGHTPAKRQRKCHRRPYRLAQQRELQFTPYL